jgi:hypothetical protein
MRKIPSHILQASPKILDPNMISAFKLLGYNCIPTWTNVGCALFVHVDSRTIRECRNAVHSVKLELIEVDRCPLIRLDVRVYDRPVNPLHMDCFLNINRHDKKHLPAIEALTWQEWMVFHWYNERLEYVRSSGIHWGEEQWEAAKNIIEEAKAIVTRTGGGDFDLAKAKFMAANPI